jgi:site-specific recombinase XerC
MTCDQTQSDTWLASLGNHGTRRVYSKAIDDFMQFSANIGAGGFRTITRVHVMAWREHLFRRGLGQGTVRHRLAALSSFFQYLCEKEIVACNPVTGVKRPKNFLDASKAQAFDDDRETPSEHKPIWMYLSY